MMSSAASEHPTTLFTPPPPPPISGDSASSPMGSGFMVIGGAMIIIAGYFFLARRRSRGISPSELAFRRLAKDLGYSKAQIGQIRKYAYAKGYPSPVGVVMSQELAGRALQNNRK